LLLWRLYHSKEWRSRRTETGEGISARWGMENEDLDRQIRKSCLPRVWEFFIWEPPWHIFTAEFKYQHFLKCEEIARTSYETLQLLVWSVDIHSEVSPWLLFFFRIWS
jgi:hypothetical protein